MSSLTRRGLLALGGAVTAAACGGGARPGRQAKKPVRKVTRLVERYGDDPLQVGEWFVPAEEDLAGTVVLVHGGFWGPQYDRHLEDKVAVDLAGRGYLCWNIDYRSSAAPWPSTLSDAAAAYDHLSDGRYADRIDPARVAVVGHSAGGHLVAWLASRHQLPTGAPGHNPAARPPSLCVPQAGVLALTTAAQENLGGGAAQRLIGGSPAQFPERYRQADPSDLLPSGVRSVVISDRNDAVVPVIQSRTYVEAATKAGDNSTLVLTPGDHFSHIDPTSEACTRMRDALATMG